MTAGSRETLCIVMVDTRKMTGTVDNLDMASVDMTKDKVMVMGMVKDIVMDMGMVKDIICSIPVYASG